MVVFWTDGETGKAIVASDYRDAHSILERVLGRFDAGERHYDGLRAKVGELAAPGKAITAVLDRNRVGLMRPYIVGDAGSHPFVVCREARGMLLLPVLCRSREEARSFVRAAHQAEGLSLADWRSFEGERLISPVARLFARTTEGSVVVRSELEEALAASFAKARAAVVEPPAIRVKRGPASIRARRIASPTDTKLGSRTKPAP
jgi:hypothetical protein